jgi:hypothetical protein
MLSTILHSHSANLYYANQLVKDLSDDQMIAQPIAGVVLNHAKWVLGHIIGGADFTCSFLGESNPVSPAGWNELFGNGSKVLGDRSKYPSKVELLTALTTAFDRRTDAMKKLTPARAAEPFPIEKFRGFWPTLGDGAAYMCTVHDATHLGQLSAWRRALGLPSVM